MENYYLYCNSKDGYSEKNMIRDKTLLKELNLNEDRKFVGTVEQIREDLVVDDSTIYEIDIDCMARKKYEIQR